MNHIEKHLIFDWEMPENAPILTCRCSAYTADWLNGLGDGEVRDGEGGGE